MYLEKLRKKLRLLYISFTMVLAVAVGVASATIWDDIPEWKILTCIAIVIFILAMGINVYWNKQFMESVQLLLPVLDRDPDQFMEDFEELTSGKHVRRQINWVYHFNMGTAYCRKKLYREALSYYGKVDVKRVRGRLNKAIYWADLALIHFELEEYDKALDILNRQFRLLDKYPLDNKVSPQLGFLIGELGVFQHIALGLASTAQELLEELLPYAVTPYQKETCEELAALIAEKQ